MRFWLIVAGILVGATAITAPASAQNYPWCAYYGGIDGGGTNCGFSTHEQCMAALSGMGGFCALNTQYVPGAAAPVPRRLRHRQHRPS